MAAPDLYATLGVKRTATAEEIKRAYRKLARANHPDVAAGPEAAERFSAAGAAYEVLRDPEKRKAYDTYGDDWENPPHPGPDPRWNGGFNFRREDVTGGDPDAFRRFFEEAFSGGGGGFGAEQAVLTVDLRDIVEGADKTVSLQIPQVDRQGRVSVQATSVRVHVPKGTLPGDHLILRGHGPGGGDLVLSIAVRPHPTFAIDGRDLIADLPVTPWEAALGATLDMPTPSGGVRVKVPPHARSGQRLRLKGKGLPGPRPGDLFARLLIVNPPIRSAEARALYERMARELAFDPRAAMKG
jgi:curved DNA-binding protein